MQSNNESAVKTSPLAVIDQLTSELNALPDIRQRFFLSQMKGIRARVKRRQPVDRALARVQSAIAQDLDAQTRRRAAQPKLELVEGLPITERAADISRALQEHPVVIVAGETGSGKTTQLPKILMQIGRGRDGQIAHTQPRRLAARAVASRIAEETGAPLGETVSYRVRFEEQYSPASLLCLMTDGMLLAELASDPLLSRYDTIVVDEAHERSLNIDFLLGYLKQCLQRRPDLKVVVTSATIDVQRFAKHFRDAPVIEVSGRSYPVDLWYRPAEEMGFSAESPEAIEQALRELREHGAQSTGDVLVFLSGEAQIREASKHLRHLDWSGLEVIPLYARLSKKEQDRLFHRSSGGRWRVVLSTNVAETSLTVPGIRYVIDCGQARISRYSVRSKLQRLPIEAVSQASARQRAGRCGREAPGIAVRLYSEEDFLSRPEFTEPEILRSNLTAVILQMQKLRLGDPIQFPFLDAPDRRLVKDAWRILEELGACQSQRLTPIGKRLSMLPIDPRPARMVVAAAELNCLSEVAIIAAGISAQDPRERPADKQQAAAQAHSIWRDEQSDFVTLLNLWQWFEEQRQQLSNNQLRRLCEKQFLNWNRMREWRDLHRQLSLALKPMGLRKNQQAADYESIHRAILSGLLTQIGRLEEKGEYIGCRDRRFRLFPGSSLKGKPKWVVATEIVETSKVYARTVAKIEPQWLLGINDGLLKRQYFEPHWQPRSGRVMAYEQTSLLGLVIRERHKVHFGDVDVAEARRLFVEEALVAGRLKDGPAFFQHNQALRKELGELEDRARRRDIITGDEQLFHWYMERLPETVCSARQLQQWLKKAPKQAVDALYLSRDWLLQSSELPSEAQFPAALEWDTCLYPLSYRFEPGKDSDGVTLKLPLALVPKAPQYLFEWLVPGLLPDKVQAMLKSLPKPIRKQLVPIPDSASQILSVMRVQDRPLSAAIGDALQQKLGLELEPQVLDAMQVDDNFYHMRIAIVDDRERELEASRDWAGLRQRWLDKARERLQEISPQAVESSKVAQQWEFDAIPERKNFRQAGVEVTAWPALTEDEEGVRLRVLESQQSARRSHRQALNRLIRLGMAKSLAQWRQRALKDNQSQLQLAALKWQRAALLDDIEVAAVQAVYLSELGDDAMPRDKSAFDALAADPALRERFQQQLDDLTQAVGGWLRALADIERQLRPFSDLAYFHSVADIRLQIGLLFYSGFLKHTESEPLQRYDTYLQAIAMRLDKLRGNQQKDGLLSQRLKDFYERLSNKIDITAGELRQHPRLQEYRWALEEYRVSLFAQSLGAKGPISEKRLKRLWHDIETEQHRGE